MKAGLIFEGKHCETYSLCSVVDGVIAALGKNRDRRKA